MAQMGVAVSHCFLGNMTGRQGSTLSDPHMITGFSPFELPTCGLLQKGRDYVIHRMVVSQSPFLLEAAFVLRHCSLGI